MDKNKIEKLKPIDVSKYENIDLDHLAIYAIGQLEKLGVELSFENAVVAIFKLFPKKFSLIGFPEYPDSLRAYSCLWRCSRDKKKQWLGGQYKQGFIITERTRKIIKEAEDLLGGLSSKKTKTTSQTRRKESIMEDVVSSSAYSKYIKGHSASISDAEICYLLQGTLDSAREMLRENLTLLKKFAEELKRADVLNFLNWLEQHFQKFLAYSQE